ncbi:MAG: TolC family protein, partial [Acidobacteria bacterium]|nr:TolC family protein [Acidobacteriota bacterium]
VTGGPDTRVESWSFTVKQPLFDGGRLAVQRALSHAQLLLDSRSYVDSEDALVDTVRGLYWQALVQQEKLLIQEEIRGITAHQVEIARMERRIGAIREIDLVEAELEEARVTLTIGDTRAILEERMDRLRESLGMGPGDELALSGKIDAAYSGLGLPDAGAFIAIALANNTQVKRRELEARSALEALRAARASFVPRISLAITVGISGERRPLQDPSLSGELAIDFPSRAFPFSASLSSGKTGSGQVSAGSSGQIGVLEDIGGWTDRRAAALAREESLLKKAQTVETLGFEVRRSAAAYEQKKAAAELQRKTVSLDEARVAILSRQLELGGIQRIDYMRAQAQLARDASDLLEDVLAVLDGERELEKLLGVRAGELAALAADLARRERE